jgi:MFS family permease
MRQRLAGADGRNRSMRTLVTRNPYLDVLRTPTALPFSSAAFVGRMSMSMYGLGTVLLIASLTGRYGTAGTVAAAGSIGYAIFGPVAANLADRVGQRRVLVPQVIVFALSTATFITCAELRVPFWLLLVTGAIAGASMPSVGSMVRSRWSALIGSDTRRLHTAFALESVNDELIFVIGPALVTVLATQFRPASGIGTAALLCTVGTALFAIQRRSEPTPRSRPANAGARTTGTQATGAGPTGAGATGAGATGAGATGAGATGASTAGTGRRSWRPSVPAPALITLSPAFLLLGAMFATIDLSTVAFASQQGHRSLAGVILGVYALGSAVGGLWYGSRQWHAPLGRRFTITAALAVAGVATFWAMPGLLALGAVVLVAGLAISPTLIAAYAILEGQAPQHRRTEAMAWLSSTVSVGVAAGSAVAGHVIDGHGARWGFGFAACCGVAAVLICLTGLGRLRTGGLAAREASATA